MLTSLRSALHAHPRQLAEDFIGAACLVVLLMVGLYLPAFL
jgi:hypothetical protein